MFQQSRILGRSGFALVKKKNSDFFGNADFAWSARHNKLQKKTLDTLIVFQFFGLTEDPPFENNSKSKPFLNDGFP